MLINSSNSFKQILVDLFNLSITTKKLPSIWKESLITMIPKTKSNSDNAKDYRPISITSNIAKIAEKLVALRLDEFKKE
jgi:hypothetical protein